MSHFVRLRSLSTLAICGLPKSGIAAAVGVIIPLSLTYAANACSCICGANIYHLLQLEVHPPPTPSPPVGWFCFGVSGWFLSHYTGLLRLTGSQLPPLKVGLLVE